MGQQFRRSLSRIVYYSLRAPDTYNPNLSWQFETSVATLRASNSAIPVALFVHGPLPQSFAAVCRRFNVMVHDQGPYEARLAAMCPAGARALSTYPLLHKYLNFRELAALRAEQALCCDLDTVFFGDVEILFDRYDSADVVAREEVYSRRSPHGADETFINEALLARVAEREARSYVPPFNLGLVLFNHGVSARLIELDRIFIDDAWRFVSWMALHPVAGTPAEQYGEFAGIQHAIASMSEADRVRSLPFPSSNRWILDEIALWLALGAVPGLRFRDFDACDAAQNGEVLATDPRSAPWVVCHYYSQNTHRIADWLRRGALPMAG